MFYKKRIEALEKQVETLKDDVSFLKTKMKDLIMYDNMLSLDQETQEMYLARKNDEEKEFFNNVKSDYEKRLKSFIRKCNSKPRTKKKFDGKENTKATK